MIRILQILQNFTNASKLLNIVTKLKLVYCEVRDIKEMESGRRIKYFYSNFFYEAQRLFKYVWIKAVCTWYRQYRVSKSIAFLRTRYIEERLKVEKCKNIFFFGYEHLLKCKKKKIQIFVIFFPFSYFHIVSKFSG